VETSILDIFKVGLVHPVLARPDRCAPLPILWQALRVKICFFERVALYGSLGLTGRGHGTD
jgi:hypothetical protein